MRTSVVYFWKKDLIEWQVWTNENQDILNGIKFSWFKSTFVGFLPNTCIALMYDAWCFSLWIVRRWGRSLMRRYFLERSNQNYFILLLLFQDSLGFLLSILEVVQELFGSFFCFLPNHTSIKCVAMWNKNSLSWIIFLWEILFQNLS